MVYVAVDRSVIQAQPLQDQHNGVQHLQQEQRRNFRLVVIARPVRQKNGELHVLVPFGHGRPFDLCLVDVFLCTNSKIQAKTISNFAQSRAEPLLEAERKRKRHTGFNINLPNKDFHGLWLIDDLALNYASASCRNFDGLLPKCRRKRREK